jgi:PD-(D/E)XK endonuclease
MNRRMRNRTSAGCGTARPVVWEDGGGDPASYPIWGPTLSNECFFNETSDPANLTNSQRGHLAELAFMRKAVGLGLSVAKPWNADERYDFIVRVETVCWRVQVKSVLAKSVARHHYRVQMGSGRHVRPKTYSASEIDFLVAYVFPEDLWYVFPAARIVGQKAICLWPGSKCSTFEQYREAWRLMKPHSPETGAANLKPAGTHGCQNPMTEP